MTKAILYQKQIMQQALETLAEIDKVKALFKGIDNKYCEQKTTELQSRYSELMTMLTRFNVQRLGYTLQPSMSYAFRVKLLNTQPHDTHH